MKQKQLKSQKNYNIKKTIKKWKKNNLKMKKQLKSEKNYNMNKTIKTWKNNLKVQKNK